MAERIKIKITDPGHLMDFGEWLGYAKALQVLEKVALADKLPGFNLAKAKIEVLEARQRAENAGKNLRLAFKAGHDLEASNVFWQGGDYIEIEPVDTTVPPDPTTQPTESK